MGGSRRAPGKMMGEQVVYVDNPKLVHAHKEEVMRLKREHDEMLRKAKDDLDSAILETAKARKQVEQVSKNRELPQTSKVELKASPNLEANRLASEKGKLEAEIVQLRDELEAARSKATAESTPASPQLAIISVPVTRWDLIRYYSAGALVLGLLAGKFFL